MRALLWCAAILLFFLLVVSGAAFVQGSMELFPTDEQEGKVRLIYGTLFALFGLLEFVVVVCLRGVSIRPLSRARR